jgi:glutaredoxin 3
LKTAEYFDVKANPGKLEEMLRYSNGVKKVPVIVEGEKVTIGYGGS